MSTTSLARDRLGVPAVLFFILSAVAPLTVVAGVVTTLYAVTGLSAIGAAFIVVAAVLAVFAVGYVAMARRITDAGAFYAFVTHGLGRTPGAAAALVALVSYNLLQVGLYGMFGPTVAAFAADRAGIDLPWWCWSLAAWAVVAALGMLRVDLNGRVLAVLLAAEVLIVAVLAAAGLGDPADGWSVTSLSPGGLVGHDGVGALLATALLGYVGFEAAAVFAEESRDPRRTVPVATYTALALIGAVYALASWSMSVHYGDDRVAEVAALAGPGMFFAMAGTLVADIAIVLFMTSLFAAMLSFHNAVARYTFSLGRSGLLPTALARTVRGVPRPASWLQSAIGLATITLYAVAGWEPTVHLFFWLGTTGGLGVLLLLATTSVAVITFFTRTPTDEPLWRRFVAPAFAAIALIVMLVTALTNYPTLLGVTPGSPAAWLLPSVYAVAALTGIALALRRRSAT